MKASELKRIIKNSLKEIAGPLNEKELWVCDHGPSGDCASGPGNAAGDHGPFGDSNCGSGCAADCTCSQANQSTIPGGTGGTPISGGGGIGTAVCADGSQPIFKNPGVDRIATRRGNLGENTLNERFLKLAGIKPLYENEENSVEISGDEMKELLMKEGMSEEEAKIKARELYNKFNPKEDENDE